MYFNIVNQKFQIEMSQSLTKRSIQQSLNIQGVPKIITNNRNKKSCLFYKSGTGFNRYQS